MTPLLTMDQAAEHLGIKRRTLTAILADMPECCTWGGKAKKFDTSHIAALRLVIEEKTKCRVTSTAKQEPSIGGSTSRSKAVTGYAEVLARLTAKPRKLSRNRSRPKNGNATSKVIPLHSHLQRPS